MSILHRKILAQKSVSYYLFHLVFSVRFTPFAGQSDGRNAVFNGTCKQEKNSTFYLIFRDAVKIVHVYT